MYTYNIVRTYACIYGNLCNKIFIHKNYKRAKFAPIMFFIFPNLHNYTIRFPYGELKKDERCIFTFVPQQHFNLCRTLHRIFNIIYRVNILTNCCINYIV